MLIHFFYILFVVILPLCAILAFVLILFFVINRIWPSADGSASRREDWRPVLDAEVKRWSAKTWEQLVSELPETQMYEVEFDSKQYQVEVEIWENTAQYVNVIVSVDDGSLPASITPLTDSITCWKQLASGQSRPEESPRPT